MRYPIDTGKNRRGLKVRSSVKAGGIDPVNHNLPALRLKDSYRRVLRRYADSFSRLRRYSGSRP